VGALAWSYSVWALFAFQETYFEESAAMIVTFVLVGRLLELSVRRKVCQHSALYDSVPQRAILAGEGGSRQIEVSEIRPGDLLLVRQGERFPVDCLIIEGQSEVDQSLVTGESVPLLLAPGDEARSGCVNVSAPVTVQALRQVGQSYLMRVAALVQMAQAGKPRLQQLADKVAGRFVPVVILLALLVGAGRFFIAGAGTGASVMTALAVVLIACPCAMGLAVPAAVLAACSRSASLGIILRGGDVIERMAGVTVALFDKTGTITVGQPTVFRFERYGDQGDSGDSGGSNSGKPGRPSACQGNCAVCSRGGYPAGILPRFPVSSGEGNFCCSAGRKKYFLRQPALHAGERGLDR
jgi:Cu2+-exporting ATPase